MELPETLDLFDNETFESFSTEYYVTCTDVWRQDSWCTTAVPAWRGATGLTGRAGVRFHAAGLLVVELDGKKLLDGAWSDSIPVMAFGRWGLRRTW